MARCSKVGRLGLKNPLIFQIRSKRLFLPSIVVVAFFLIADIDSPRHGIIRVVPQNLEALLKASRDTNKEPTLF